MADRVRYTTKALRFCNINGSLSSVLIRLYDYRMNIIFMILEYDQH